MTKVRTIYVGIDPGANGAITAITDAQTVLFSKVVPKVKGTTEVDYTALYEMFEFINAMGEDLEANIVTVIEDVHSIYGSSAKSNFSFGKIVGVKHAFLVALDYDYKLIPPKKWQKRVIEDSDIVKDAKGKKDTKATALNAATRLFPGVDLRKSKRSTKAHDGIVDALLMAEFGRVTDNED